MKDQARDYQDLAITEIKAQFLQGIMKVLLWLATGGGKTFIFCKMVKEASLRGKKAIVVVRGRKLVDQASKRLTREGVPHGVFMAKHWNYRPTLPIQVCSIDTLLARGIFPEADLVIIDEAHLATSPGYHEFVSHYPNARFVSVTATPYPEKGTLQHIAQTIVKPTSMVKLIDDGYLVDFRYFGAEHLDLSGVKISSTTKDYIAEDLEKVMVQGQLTGNIISHWKEVVKDLPTICFAVNISHSKYLVERFIEAGIPAAHCDADTPEEEREELIKKLESGEIKILSNVGILCTGVDIPSLGAIIGARPTKSFNLFIQMCGRLTRPIYAAGFDLSTAEGRKAAIAASKKPKGILLDHAGNLGEGAHGFPTDEPDVDLSGKRKLKILRESKTCKKCFCVYREPRCPECGEEAPERSSTVVLEESDDKLREIVQVELDPVKRAHKAFLKEAKETGKKPTWAHYKVVDKFGFEKCLHVLPEWFADKYKKEREASNLFVNSPFKGFS